METFLDDREQPSAAAFGAAREAAADVSPGWRATGRLGLIADIMRGGVETAPSIVRRASFRLLDISVAGGAIILFLPLLMLLLALVAISSPGPVLFIQQRIGRRGAMFPCLKIRTMRIDADAILARLLEEDADARAEWGRDHKLRNDPRVTPIGRWLRKLSLDELPQLFNILAGQMSVVGPRPIVPAEISRYGVHFADYCRVRPGLTGLWQVSGRNDMPYADRVRLDARYAHSKSIRTDLSIMIRTIPAVLGARGCY